MPEAEEAQMDVDPTMIDPSLSDSTIDHSPALPRPANNNTNTTTNDDDDDPIVASYNILLKPSLPAHRKVMILEHPNKSDGKKMARVPLEIRMKTATGMIEVDYPIDYNAFYDRNKGLNWGTHLHKSNEAKKGGSHGLAGGFGVGAPPPRPRAGGRGAQDDSFDPGMDWAEALRKDYVLRTQTLGGQMPDTSAESKYMVGVFAGPSSLVHLRPQLHHIDATSEQERLSAARGATGAAGAAAKPEVARAIHMTVKQTADGSEEIVQETMADRLKKVQLEPWKRMRYVHEEASDSWAVAEDALFLHRAEAAAAAAAAEQGASSGKEPEVLDQPNMPELVEKVAQLRTAWNEDGMLETTSGISKPKNVKIEISDDEPAGPSSKAKGKGRAIDTGPNKTAGRAAKAKATSRGKRTTNSTVEVGPSKANKND
ncbi:DNA-directed RNA polymerase III subunit rpc5 [Cytospora mali]|uniref:DNA-directed RNA polymerase III subunit rpc5 n=1 Tax=Cytospora mali TaxID=578113 RepID=A0A194UQ68_CYTMA|nr:DNA-directed RNA polymerase III subunit rpc5 [Valsa mali var. pyri (nom. inval.)]